MRRFLVVLLILGFSSVAYAEEAQRSADEISRMTRQISQEIYSPYCPGKTLAMCPSGQALDARMEIQEWARQGQSVEEIKATLLERYGAEHELVEPPTRDNATLLGTIIGGLLLAVLAVGFLASRRLTTADEETADDASESPLAAADATSSGADGYLDELRSEVSD